MNIRQKYELKTLSDDGYLDMTKVADDFSLNLRTIRYDMGILNEYLKPKYEEECIIVKSKIAYVDEQIQVLLREYSDLSVKDFYTDKLSNEERELMILFDVCWTDAYCMIGDLANKYFVSRATVNNDLVNIKEYCKRNGIPFVSNRGKGLRVEGTEQDRRKYLARIIKDFSSIKKYGENQDTTGYSQWFAEAEFLSIKMIVKNAEEEFGVYLSDVAFEALVVHVALSVERCKQHEMIYEKLGETDAVSLNTEQYKMAKQIVLRVNEQFHVALPDQEIQYVALHIGAKSSQAVSQRQKGDVYLECSCIRLIAKVGREMGYDLTDNENLYERLLQHMSVCLYRKKNNLPLENPLKDELLTTYPNLYQILKNSVDANITVLSDDEISYILLHFAAALHDKEQNINRIISVVVVCATGAGTAELVKVGLQKHFKMNIKGTVARHHLEDFLRTQEVDMIISTVPVPAHVKRSFIQVSPFLKRADIVNLGKRILDMGFDIEKPEPDSEHWSETARQLQYLLKLYCHKNQEEYLREKILEFTCQIKAREQENKKKGEEKIYMLSELLNEKTIRLDVSCGNWEDAVKASGEPLIKTGDITEEYVNAVINNVKELGPYIVLTKGIALPHATNKVGVNHTAMSFIRVKNPVEFGNKDNDPVKFLFMLAAEDGNSHLGALSDFVRFMDDKEFMNLLDSAGSPMEIISYIKCNETQMI